MLLQKGFQLVVLSFFACAKIFDAFSYQLAAEMVCMQKALSKYLNFFYLDS